MWELLDVAFNFIFWFFVFFFVAWLPTVLYRKATSSPRGTPRLVVATYPAIAMAVIGLLAGPSCRKKLQGDRQLSQTGPRVQVYQSRGE